MKASLCVWILCIVAAAFAFTYMFVPAFGSLQAAEPQETVTTVTVSGPCSCTATVYVEGGEVDRDRCAWRVSGDTLFIFISMKK